MLDFSGSVSQADCDQGSFLKPTILKEIKMGGTIAATEIFGPVLGLLAADSLDEAIRMVNQGQFGNMACIITGSGAAAPMAFSPSAAGKTVTSEHCTGRAAGPLSFTPKQRWWLNAGRRNGQEHFDLNICRLQSNRPADWLVFRFVSGLGNKPIFLKERIMSQMGVALLSSRNLVFQVYGKVLGLLLAMLFGVVFSQAHVLSGLIRFLLMAMLFFSFLDLEIKKDSFQRKVYFILVGNVAIAFLGYWLVKPFGSNLALAAYLTGIAPTAIASPIMVDLLRKKVDFVVAAILLTNIGAALIVPLTLPFLAGEDLSLSVWSMLAPTLMVMFVPFVMAWMLRRSPTGVQVFIRKGKRFNFFFWLLMLFIICAKSVDFIKHEYPGSLMVLLSIALIALVICVVNFSLGAVIGGNQYRQEASQALGQKNISFVVWIALSFFNPLVALGPTFYIFFHNLYNSFQIYAFERNHRENHSLTL